MSRKYNYNFEKIKNHILYIFDFECYMCGYKSLSNHVHHIDKNPDNNNVFNFMVLCVEHHKLVHKNVKFKPYVIEESKRMQLEELEKQWERLSINSISKV